MMVVVGVSLISKLSCILFYTIASLCSLNPLLFLLFLNHKGSTPCQVHVRIESPPTLEALLRLMEWDRLEGLP